MKVSNLVPNVYYRDSRDFSYIGRLFEIVFNYLKTNVDLIDASPINDEVPSMLITLASMTLGFESRHEYVTKDLVAVCSSFTELLRNKGNVQAIEKAINILIHTQNIKEDVYIEINPNDRFKFDIYVPSQLNDIILLEDLFDYILPIGFTYSIKFASYNKDDVKTTDVGVLQSLQTYKMDDNQLAQVSTDIDDARTIKNTDESKYGPSINGEVTTDENRSMTYTGVVFGEVGQSQEGGSKNE